MKDKYELICDYCNHSWKIDYRPQYKLNCLRCNDRNIRAIDLSSKIDYYAGSPPFPDEITLELKNHDNYNY